MEPLRQRGPCHGDAERLGGLDGGDAGFAQPCDRAQRVGAGCEDAGGRAEGVQQDPGEFPGLGSGVRSRQQELQKLAVVDGLAAGTENAGPKVVVTGAGGALRVGRAGNGAASRRPGAGAPEWLNARPSRV